MAADAASPAPIPADGFPAKPKQFRAPTTWHLKSRRERNFFENLISIDLGPEQIYEKTPGIEREDPPQHSILLENCFCLFWSFLPILAQDVSYRMYPDLKWNAWAAWLVHLLTLSFFAIHLVKRLHHYSLVYGVFDQENRGRDLIPDKRSTKLAVSIIIFVAVRTGLPILLKYNKNVKPLDDLSWKTPFKLAAWEIVLDYWFYLYHRSCHEVDFLWGIHKAHHATKHPTAALSILADEFQEMLEVVLIPSLATLVVPLKYHELWVASLYLMYVEMLGHSGVRADWNHPVLTPILKPFGVELAVEDHDLHHRYGKGGKNYGKQTRIWDRLFGTVCERIDTKRSS